MSDANVQDDCKWQVVEAKWLGVLEIESIKDIYQYWDQVHCFDKKFRVNNTIYVFNCFQKQSDERPKLEFKLHSLHIHWP